MMLGNGFDGGLIEPATKIGTTVIVSAMGTKTTLMIGISIRMITDSYHLKFLPQLMRWHALQSHSVTVRPLNELLVQPEGALRHF